MTSRRQNVTEPQIISSDLEEMRKLQYQVGEVSQQLEIVSQSMPVLPSAARLYAVQNNPAQTVAPGATYTALFFDVDGGTSTSNILFISGNAWWEWSGGANAQATVMRFNVGGTQITIPESRFLMNPAPGLAVGAALTHIVTVGAGSTTIQLQIINEVGTPNAVVQKCSLQVIQYPQ